MSKRLHDTEIWRGLWFRKLPKESKMLWFYLLDTCNCAGIVDIDDFEQMSFLIGFNITEKNLLDLSKQLKKIDQRRGLILDFIDFQYGHLHESHKMYNKVIAELAKFNIKYPIDTLSIQYQYSTDTVKDKDKDKDINTSLKKEDKKGKERTWRSSFWLYRKMVILAYREIIGSPETIKQQQELNPNLDVLLSIKKGIINFWGTKAGWKYKKGKKSAEINMKSTLINSIDHNRVFKPREQSNSSYQEYTPAQKEALRNYGK